jgi:proton-dependent oligopeptide transporter, POT family
VAEADNDAGVHPEPPAFAHSDSEKKGGDVDLEAGSGSVGAVDISEYPPPTEEERLHLRKVPDSIPWVAYMLCLVEMAERASYYGANTVWNNFIEFPLPDDGPGTGAVNKDNPNDTAGALNMGLQASSGLVLAFQFLAYVIPIFGAWIADTKLGRMKTILIGVLIGGIAHIILIFGALPSV